MSVESPKEEEIIEENNEGASEDEKKKEEKREGRIPTPLEKSREDSEWWRHEK